MFDRHISGQLVPYIDGQLASPKVRQAEQHLAQCERCRRELEQVRFGIAVVEHLTLVDPPDALWMSIEHALDRREPRRTFSPALWRFAAAALVVIVISAAAWLYSRRPDPRLEVARLAGSPSVAFGQIDTDALSRARIKVGEIGTVDVEPNTSVRLLKARGAEHRLALRSGTISAKISAPPRLFFVETPSGTAVDLGCEYKLECDRDGSGLLRVTAGWVSYEWSYEGRPRESLVPAGAICRTKPRLGPGTPYFEDAPETLIRALERFDFENGGPAALDTVLAASRVRDTLTLWHLLSRAGSADRLRVFDRMTALSPPPPGISREQILRLDADALNRWRAELAWTW